MIYSSWFSQPRPVTNCDIEIVHARHSHVLFTTLIKAHIQSILSHRRWSSRPTRNWPPYFHQNQINWWSPFVLNIYLFYLRVVDYAIWSCRGMNFHWLGLLVQICIDFFLTEYKRGAHRNILLFWLLILQI